MSAFHEDCTVKNVLGEVCGIPVVFEYGEVTPYCVKCTAKRERIEFINRQTRKRIGQEADAKADKFCRRLVSALILAWTVAVIINR